MNNHEVNNIKETTSNDIKNFINILNDYLDEKKNTDESNLYLKILKNSLKKLDYKTQKDLQEYIYQKAQKTKNRDDKLQLLELYATIENNSIPENNEYEKIDFDVVWWTINWKYKIRESEIIPLWNWKFLIKIEAIKRQNKFINYRRNAEIEIKYNPRNWVIRYNDWYWRYRIATINHKIETKFNINKYKKGNHEYIKWTIYRRWTLIPIRVKVRWQKIDLILKF